MTKPTRKAAWQAALLILTPLLTVIGTAWALSADRAAIVEEIRANTAARADHESRLREVELLLAEIAADCRWIRKSLDHRRDPDRP